MSAMKNKISLVLLLLISFCSRAQVSISPQVIGTSGNTGTTPSGNTIDYTVGEVMVQTYSPAVAPFTVKHLTQGFQQPNSTTNALNISVASTNSTCTGANNGTISIQILTSSTPSISYVWSNSNNTGTLSNLAPGTYYYTVSDGNFTITDSVIITEDAVDCGEQLTFYSGVTPNGDGNNDTWQIDNITNIKENKVWIYNRWGDVVWKGDNYDNNTVVWKGTNVSGGALPDATYFYVIEAGGKTYKGWIELTH